MNYLGILVSAIVSMAIGSVWYGPLFGKQFAKAMGMDSMSQADKDRMKQNMMWPYIGQFVASLVMFFVLDWYIGSSSQMGAGAGMVNALWLWLGFVVPVKFGDAIWGGKMTLFWIGISNMLVTLLAAGAVLGAWR